MVGHGGSSAGSYLADPTSPIPSHCPVIILFKSVPVHQRSWLYSHTLQIWMHFISLVNIPVEGIRLLDAVCLLLGKRRHAWQMTPFAAVWSQPGVVCSENVTFDPLTRRPVDLFKKEPLKGNSEVHLHTPTMFGEDPSKDFGGVGEQTNKRCSNYSMTRKFTRRASKRRCVLFAAVWREPGGMIRRVLFAAGWREPGVVCYHI